MLAAGRRLCALVREAGAELLDAVSRRTRRPSRRYALVRDVGGEWIGAVWIGAMWIGAVWIGAMWIGAVWIGAMWIGAELLDALSVLGLRRRFVIVARAVDVADTAGSLHLIRAPQRIHVPDVTLTRSQSSSPRRRSATVARVCNSADAEILGTL